MKEQYTALIECGLDGGGIGKQSLAVWDFLFDCQRELNVAGDLLEIGVWQGVGLAAMALNARSEEETIGVDLFIQKDAIENNYAKIFNDPARPNIRFEQGNSIDLRKKGVFNDKLGGIRWLHIDGEHSYNGVRSDLDLAANLICDGGIIVIDDFFNIGSACIANAVFDALRENAHQYRMFLADSQKAYLSTPQYFGRYRQMCLHSLLSSSEEKFDVKLTVSQNGYSTEIDYITVFERYLNYKGMRIGSWLDDVPQLAS